ncbi:hypothetical protein L3X38_004638 [Prunus dulcis]|uniref:Uncharacterized protein n=1 Tax=Prunus dulcis TaxID=3755 RepID=A0AAD4ZPE0_PRUDU|nr:hypothetical protein L3X38_004638 [Prunus dulcis]
MTLPKCLRLLSGSESPLNGVMVCIENLIGRVAYSISSVNNEEFTWSTSLRTTSSKSPSTLRPWSRSFTSFSMSSTRNACGSYWGHI